MLKKFKNIKTRLPVPLFNVEQKLLYYQGSCLLFVQEERRKENF